MSPALWSAIKSLLITILGIAIPVVIEAVSGWLKDGTLNFGVYQPWAVVFWMTVAGQINAWLKPKAPQESEAAD